MPDPIEMLTQDHRKVEALFEKYSNSQSPEVVRQICTELTVHTAIEEREVYPVLGSDVDNGRQMCQHAEHEHGEVKNAISSIEEVGYEGPEVEGFMQQIIEGVTEHVSEEEGEVFPAMRSQISEERMSEMGEKAQAVKQELMSEAEQAGPLTDLTKEKLYGMAQEKGIDGRSRMTKEELISALKAS